LSVDRHVTCQRRGVDCECFGDRQFLVRAEHDRLSGKRTVERNDICAAASH